MRTPPEIEQIGRDTCKLRTDDELVWSFNAIERLRVGALGDDATALTLSRAWLFEELDARGLLPRIGVCGGCYLDTSVVPCDCETVV